MAAVIRVKRRRCQDAAENLVVSCKKPRNEAVQKETDANCQDSQVENVLKFAGTINYEDACVASHIRDAIKKEKLQREFKCHIPDVAEKARSLHRKIIKTGRYKVVAGKRAIQLEDLDKATENEKDSRETRKHVHCECESQTSEAKSNSDSCCNDKETLSETKRLFYLYDIEAEGTEKETTEASGSNSTLPDVVMCNNVPMIREKIKRKDGKDLKAAGADFVYDLYYMNQRDFDFRQLENMLSIEAYKEDYDFQEYRSNDWEEHYDDDDDSNDEGNWRNDYPDEDPMFYESEEVQDYLQDAFERGANDEEEYKLRNKFKSLLAREESCDLSSDEDSEYLGLPPDLAAGPGRSYESYMKTVKQELDIE